MLVWLGWAMVLGSFQCRGILLLLHIVWQGPAVLAASAGRVGYIFYIFHLSSLSNVLSFGRWLNLTEILWFWLLNKTVVVSYCQGRPRLVLGNHLEGLSLPREQCHYWLTGSTWPRCWMGRKTPTQTKKNISACSMTTWVSKLSKMFQHLVLIERLLSGMSLHTK